MLSIERKQEMKLNRLRKDKNVKKNHKAVRGKK
jgi:hypothetical protein